MAGTDKNTSMSPFPKMQNRKEALVSHRSSGIFCKPTN